MFAAASLLVTRSCSQSIRSVSLDHTLSIPLVKIAATIWFGIALTQTTPSSLTPWCKLLCCYCWAASSAVLAERSIWPGPDPWIRSVTFDFRQWSRSVMRREVPWRPRLMLVVRKPPGPGAPRRRKRVSSMAEAWRAWWEKDVPITKSKGYLWAAKRGEG